MSTEQDRLHEFLSEIQLEQFFYLIVRNLHVTRLAHFDHVEEIDLTGIGMSKPEQRRLFDHLKKSKRPSLKKLFRKSFRRDSEKGKSPSPPKEAGTFENSSSEQPSVNDPIVAARNNIQQGLKCLIQQKDLVLGDFLGKGAFGYVRKGVWTTDKGSQLNVAVKCLKPNQDAATVMLQGEFIKEANAMSKLDHPNLIRLYGIVLTTPMMLVTELAPVGSLLTRLRKEPDKFMISILCSFVVQIVSGMKYLEMNRFIHRDLAARNILLVSYEKIKIGDFGLMRALPSDADYYVMQPNGLVPFAWCATECLKYRRFSHASDVWAFGVTVLEIFSYGQEPWPGLNGAEILEKIDAPNFLRPERPDHCPVEMYKIMKHHCWNHNPEERSSFEALEKMILEVLPKEINALCDYYPEHHGVLSFKKGDPLTIIEASHDPSFVKVQNRRNGKVGYTPVKLLSATGVKSPDTKPRIPSLSSKKGAKFTQSDRGKLLEPDSMSVASRASSSSSGSNSSSEYTSARHSMNIAHSKPKDIPLKRQSTMSSGIGSSGPSCASSYKEDVILPGVIESDYGSHDDSVSLTSKKSATARSIAGDKASIGAYENTTVDGRSQTPYENVSPREQITGSQERIFGHSKPMAIPGAGYEFPHIFTIPKDPKVPGSPHLHIVSLPCHNSENEPNESVLNLSSDSEFENALSCSAPTTKRELKAVRVSRRKQSETDEFSHRASFGSYKQKQILPDPVYQFVDNLLYESMNTGQTYEMMKDNFTLQEQKRYQETYENVEPQKPNTSSSETDSFSYENVVLGSRKQTGDHNTSPPLPPKTYRVSENEAPLPARTYRQPDKGPSRRHGYPDNSYENTDIQVRPKTYSQTSAKLPPRTYKQLSSSYENAEICRKTSTSSKSSYENCALSCSSNSASYSLDTSYENFVIKEARDSSYENCDLEDSPPPLPKKRLSRSDYERSLSPGSQSDSRPPSRISTGQKEKEQTVIYKIDESNTLTDSSIGTNVETEAYDSEKRNLIDDSPVHKKLPCKYGTIWDGQEIANEHDDIKDTKDECKEVPCVPIPCEELISVPSANLVEQELLSVAEAIDVKERGTASASDPELLQALLSPKDRRYLSLNRTQSEDCPVPPPRKHRDKSKSGRRHTVGTIYDKQSHCSSSETSARVESDRQSDMPAADDSFQTLDEVDSRPKPCDSASCKEKVGEFQNEGDSDAPPLPPRIASDIELKREDSDFVDIDVEDLQTAERLNDSDSAEINTESLTKISGVKDEDKGRKVEGKPNYVEEKQDKGKTETAKTRFSRIKSLLSGKISSTTDTTTQVEVAPKTAQDKGTECEAEEKDDADDDETRYVLHFVTPV